MKDFSQLCRNLLLRWNSLKGSGFICKKSTEYCADEGAGRDSEGRSAEEAKTQSETFRQKYRRQTHLWRATLGAPKGKLVDLL